MLKKCKKIIYFDFIGSVLFGYMKKKYVLPTY